MDTINLDVTKAIMVTMDVNMWAASCKLTRDEISGSVNLPPDELATLGSKRLFNPDKLKVFGKLKTQAYRAIDKVGVRFMPSAWFVSETEWPELVQTLEGLKTQWDAALDEFCATYEEGCRDWIRQFPQWANILRNAMPDVDKVRSKYGYRHIAVRVAPVNDDAKVVIAGLSDAAMEDMLRTANEVWDTIFDGRTAKVTHRTLSPVRDLSRKLYAMTFANPSCGIISGILDAMLARTDGRDITQTDEAMVRAMVNTLRTADGAASLLDRYGSFADEEAVLNDMIGVTPDAVEPEPVAPVVEEPKSMDDMLSMLDLL